MADDGFSDEDDFIDDFQSQIEGLTQKIRTQDVSEQVKIFWPLSLQLI